jgi:hypothetical protein
MLELAGFASIFGNLAAINILIDDNRFDINTIETYSRLTLKKEQAGLINRLEIKITYRE